VQTQKEDNKMIRQSALFAIVTTLAVCNGCALKPTIVSEITSHNTVSPKEISVSCPPGMVLAGGGAKVNSKQVVIDQNLSVYLRRNAPHNPTTWIAEGTQESGTPTTWHLGVYAICVKGTPQQLET
jgi:hypothetical protein